MAYDQGGELRVAGWSSRNRLRPGSKHLCGQTCLHKLVDEFVAKAISGRAQGGADEIDVLDRVAERAADRAADRAVNRPTEAVARATDHYHDRGIERVAERAGTHSDVLDGYVPAGPVYGDGESSARLIKPASPSASAPSKPLPFRAHPELVPTPSRPQVPPETTHPNPHPDPSASPAAAAESSQRFSTRQWRAEAWNRERSRELRNGNPDVPARRRSGS